MKIVRRSVPLAGVALALVLAGCGSKDKETVNGTRIPVLNEGPALVADPELGGRPVNVSPAFRNTEWPQAGGVSSHAMYHLDASSSPKLAWTADLGAGDSDGKRLSAPPVVTLDTVYAMDTDANVTAFATEDGKRRWRVDLTPEDDEAPLGFLGGLAYANGRIYATTGFGELVALDAGTGKEIWRKSVGIPFRAAPTVDGGRVFASTQDNQLYAFSADTGEVQWNYVGLAESAGYLGAASPAVAGEVVLAPFSSGEIVALRVENGRSVWQTSLTPNGQTGALGSINDIRGQIVVDRGSVFAASASGFIADIDLRTGDQKWERAVGSGNTPWVGGEAVFVQSDNNILAALSWDRGQVFWATQLPRYEDEEDKSDPIVWFGPVLAGDRLFLAGSTEQLLIAAPGNGEVLGHVDLPGKAATAPVVANGTIYVVTSNGRLAALR